MEGCTTNFSGASGADSYNSADRTGGVEDSSGDNRICAIPPPENSYQKGDKITSENGIVVEVSDIAIPKGDDLPIVCFNFYLGDAKLNDEYVCVSHPNSPESLQECSFDSFSDYGVEVKYKFLEGDKPLLDVQPAFGDNVIDTPLDLYNLCVDFKGLHELGCMRYIKDEIWDRIYVKDGEFLSEEMISEGGFKVFYPPSSFFNKENALKAMGQLQACTELVDGIFQPASDALDSPTLRIGYMLSGVIGECYIMEWPGIIKADFYLMEPQEDKCADGLLAEQLTYCTSWDNAYYITDIFSKGMAKFISYNYIDPPKDYVLDTKGLEFDRTFEEGQSFEIVWSEDISAKYKLGEIAPDHVVFYKTHIDSGAIYPAQEIVVSTPRIWNIGFYKDDSRSLIIDRPQIDGDKKAVRIRLLKNSDVDSCGYIERLECTEDSFERKGYCPMEGDIYKTGWSGGKFPYVSLDGGPDYNSDYLSHFFDTATCFFDGLKQEYEKEGKPFGNFLPSLTATVENFASLPVKEQLNDFCILDAMQAVVDGDLGAGAFDINAYASKFGYEEGISNWCGSFNVYYGSMDLFGVARVENSQL